MAVFADSVGAGNVFNETFLAAFGDFTLWKHTAKGSNIGVLVGLSYSVTTTTLSSLTRTVTYDGVAMTSLGVMAWNSLSAGGWTEVFGAVGVDAGKATIFASVTGAGLSPRVIRGSSMSYTGVDSFGTVTTAAGSGTSLSVAGTASAASMIAAIFGTRSGLSSFNRTQRYLNNTFTSLEIGDAQGTGSSLNFTASRAQTGPWSGMSVVLNPADTVASSRPLVVAPSFTASGSRLPRPGIPRRTVFTIEPSA